MSAFEVIGGLALSACLGFAAAAFLRLPAGRVPTVLTAFVVCTGLWALGDVVASHAGDMLWKQVGLAILYTGSIFLPLFWWLLVVRWSQGLGCPLPVTPRRWAWLPLVWPGALWLLMLTNPWHGEFITPRLDAPNEYQPAWWLMAVVNYGLIVAALGLAAWTMRRVGTPEVRKQGALVMAAGVVTLVGNLAYVLMREPNATLLTLAGSGSLLVVGMYREGLFGVLPVALPTIAHHDPDGVLVVRADGRVAYQNPAAQALFAPLQLGVESRFPGAIGGQLRDAQGMRLAASGPEWEERFWASLARPEGAVLRLDRDGGRWLRLSCREVRSRTGTPRALCVRVRDVSDERAAETTARRARRLESAAELAGGVSRDFAGLLGVIEANAQLLEEGLSEDPALERRLGRILDAAQSAHDLSDELRRFAGGASAHLQPVELSESVISIAGRFGESTGTPIGLSLDLVAEPVIVEADPERLRDALCELVRNARQALREVGGAVRVQTGVDTIDPVRRDDLVAGNEQPAGRYGYVRIEDDGAGMAPAVHERVFEPFFTTSEKRRGLGLSHVLGMVRSLGGLLALETQVGRGTAVTLYLPLDPATHGPEPDVRSGAEPAGVESGLQDPTSGAVVHRMRRR